MSRYRRDNMYHVKLIGPSEKDEILAELSDLRLFERKANLHGACVKLLTDDASFKEEWEDNFKFMSDDVRPHAKVFAISDGGDLEVLYEPVSKTVIIRNCDYYGWVKSIALAAVSDFFEEYHSEHRRYSVHGSALDRNGEGLAIIGPPGTGKTTLTYGLLLERDYSYVSDDWFFTRLFENGVLVYASEKNSYIRDDIGDVWGEYSDIISSVKLDSMGRGIADVGMLFRDRIRDSTTLKRVVLLERNPANPPVRRLKAREGLEYMAGNDFCNPHLLIRDKRKTELRRDFFMELFSRVELYILNTIETPRESLERLRSLEYSGEVKQ